MQIIYHAKDFLAKNSCRINFDLNCIRIKDQYVPLQNDICIASLVRLCKTVTFKPQTTYRLPSKLKQNPSIPENSVYEVTAVEKGFLTSDPYIKLTLSLSTVTNKRRVPVIITNFSNKIIRVKRGCVLGRVRPIDKETSVTSLTTDHHERPALNISSVNSNVADGDLVDMTSPRKQINVPLHKSTKVGDLDTMIFFPKMCST